MRTTRLIIAPLTAAALTTAMAGPAGAVPADTRNQPNGWYTGKSTIQGATQSDTGTANVYVPPADLGLSDATTQSPAPPTRPAHREPIADSHAVANAPASGLDGGSAAIGAAAGIGAFAIALALVSGLRRRRIARPRSLTTH
jgi:hypothetical protein